MADPDLEFMDGFDKYSNENSTSINNLMQQGEWNQVGGSMQFREQTAVGTGQFLYYTASDSLDYSYKLFPTTYGRCIGGVWSMSSIPSNTVVNGIFVLGQGTSITLGIYYEQDGTVSLRLGDYYATQIEKSTIVIPSSQWACIEWDLCPKSTDGYAKVWIDGILAIDFTGNTAGQADGYTTIGFKPYRQHSWDHFYSWHYVSTTSAGETPALTQPVIQTDFPSADSSIEFDAVYDSFGGAWTAYEYDTVYPGYACLGKYTPSQSGNLEKVIMFPVENKPGINIQAVVYADNAGVATGALLGQSATIVGATASVYNEITLSSPIAVTAGVPIWVGFVANDYLYLQYNAGTSSAFFAATVGSPPATGGGGSRYAPRLWGVVSGVADFAGVVAQKPPFTYRYTEGELAGDADLYDFAALSSDPSAIHSVAVKSLLNKTDAGVKTISDIALVGGTEYAGDNPAQSAPLTASYVASYFRENPAGGAWTKAALDAAKFGYRIDS